MSLQMSLEISCILLCETSKSMMFRRSNKLGKYSIFIKILNIMHPYPEGNSEILQNDKHKNRRFMRLSISNDKDY